MKYFHEKHLRSLTTCLYFVCFFVKSGKGECPRPQGQNNMVLTNEALLMNHFPEGSTATFECSNGYVIEQGSGVVRCTSGAWSEPQMTCQKKDCGTPKKILHMNYDLSEGTLFGAKVRMYCDEGFQLEGTSYRHCYATGWSGRAKCEDVICDKPTEIKNGTIVSSHTGDVKYLEVVEYSCDEGYTLVGNNSVFCNDNGEYSRLPPECKEPSSIGTTEAETSTNSKSPSEKSSKAPTRLTPTWIQGKHEIIEKNEQEDMPARNSGYTVVIMSVISTVIIVVILLYILHRFVKRKGSYHTGEDTKADLVQFHYYKYTPRTPVGAVGQPVPGSLRGGGGGQVMQSL
ncbi:complement decay-accelerating factor isoform X4 [Osmerus mordax]|uniref:complement decay-accelerating factor isoform X4 n=1 Tax=Osmerus mordax TaxID=8014 RepID=UPI00350FC627